MGVEETSEFNQPCARCGHRRGAHAAAGGPCVDCLYFPDRPPCRLFRDQPRGDSEDQAERDYLAGKRAALLVMLRHILDELGVKDPVEVAKARWVIERQDAIARLREACAAHGDNDWEDDLHLGDVIEKHLGNYLAEAAEDRRADGFERDLAT